MTYNELVRYIKKQGRQLIANGSRHDVYINHKTGGKARVLRHGTQEAKTGTLNAMLTDLGLK